MKILAIRGQDLASLEQPFDIDLQQGPLGRLGLFAITGPTGAGKSTLLDAVCLCLYDKTPRFEKTGGAAVILGDQDADAALAANDQRNILRRGAGYGWAEVVFRGRDGRTWTARWEVRRARKRADGRVQNQVLTLTDDRGAVVGSTKTETLDAIRAQVGLDFEQFRRSVLLAQGDFAAFLRAGENERAELLEQMTGTEVYRRLASAASAESKTLRGQRKELETRLDAQGLLDDETRALAEQTLAQATVQRKGAAAAVAAAEEAVRWHQDHATLQANVDQARTALERAQAAWEAAAERRANLDRADRAWDLRLLVQRARDAQDHADRAEHSRATAAAEQIRAAQVEADARATRARALAEVARASQALANHVEERQAAARQAQTALAQWQDAHAQHRRMADPERLADLTDRLDQRRQARQDTQALARRVEALQAAARTAGAAQQQADADKQAAFQAEQQARQALLEAQARGPDPQRDAQLRQRRDWLDTRRATLAELVRISDQARVQARARIQAQTDHDAAQAQINDAQGQVRLAREGIEGLAPRLEEAQRALDQARTAVDATQLREGLLDGQACPVCGSTEHPWGTGSPLVGLFEQHQQRVRDLDQQRQALLATAARHDATAQAATRSRDRAGQDLQRTQGQLSALALAWRSRVDALEPPSLPPPQDAEAALAALQEQVARDLEDLAREEEQAHRCRAMRDEAQATLQTALDQARKAADTLSAREREAAATAGESDRARDEQRTQIDRQAQLEAELAALMDPATEELPAVAAWRDQPGLALAACVQAGETWREKEQQRRATLQTESELEALLVQARLQARQALAQTCTEDLALTADVTPPTGVPPAAQTEWLEAAVRAAEQRRDQTTTHAQAAVEALGAATQAAAVAAATATTRADAANDARQQLADQCRTLDLDPAALAWLVALPADWRSTEKAALQSLESAPAQARTLLEERSARILAHAGSRPDLDAAAASETLETAREARDRSDVAWSTARHVIQKDDEARSQVSSLQQQLRTHDQRARPWLELAECIAHPLEVFRKFAQSLTLELLLEQANRHLQQLHRRYSLARIHGTDLEILVVDHDLADEPRTVQSLSGGEAFLVSLALALGLSSLSARDVRVESLFIDEGFGTLDGRTLETALSVLDSLQAAGRQVGIISHVGGLAERIGAQVRVEPQGGGRSIVRVVDH